VKAGEKHAMATAKQTGPILLAELVSGMRRRTAAMRHKTARFHSLCAPVAEPPRLHDHDTATDMYTAAENSRPDSYAF
jgi:hypothetical protein